MGKAHPEHLTHLYAVINTVTIHKRIEQAALNAWPALQQLFYDVWLLRFADGYTKRANSVNPLCASSLDVHTKIAVCEQIYAQKGLPLIFRLTPHVSPQQLDRVLEQRQYHDVDHSLVLYRELQHLDLPPPSRGLRIEALDDWMESFARLSRSHGDQHQTHKQMLEKIPTRRLLVSLREDDMLVACGMGVLEDRYFLRLGRSAGEVLQVSVACGKAGQDLSAVMIRSM